MLSKTNVLPLIVSDNVHVDVLLKYTMIMV